MILEPPLPKRGGVRPPTPPPVIGQNVHNTSYYELSVSDAYEPEGQL